MAEREVTFSISNGATLEYSTDGSAWTRIYGLTNIPEIGGEPNEVSTTCLDNTEYETAMYGLKPVVKLNLEFNMEDPSVGANITVVHDMDKDTVYQWKITRSNGIKHNFRSKVQYGFQATQSGDLEKFSLFLSPIGEVETSLS